MKEKVSIDRVHAYLRNLHQGDINVLIECHPEKGPEELLSYPKRDLFC